MLEDRFVQDLNYIVRIIQPLTLREFDPSKYSKIVPASLVSIWMRCGVASWADGGCQTCDPKTYADACAQVLSGFSIFEGEPSIPYIISAYGLVRTWHKKFGQLEIQFPLSRVIMTDAPSQLAAKLPGDIDFISHFPTTSGHFATIRGFEADRARIGRLGENEVYGFFPALAFGGGSSPDHVQRVQADVHLDFLAGLQPFQLLYFDGRGYSPVDEG